MGWMDFELNGLGKSGAGWSLGELLVDQWLV